MLLPGSAIADLFLLEVSGCVVTPENLRGAGQGAINLSLSLSLAMVWGFKYNAGLLHLPRKILKH